MLFKNPPFTSLVQTVKDKVDSESIESLYQTKFNRITKPSKKEEILEILRTASMQKVLSKIIHPKPDDFGRVGSEFSKSSFNQLRTQAIDKLKTYGVSWSLLDPNDDTDEDIELTRWDDSPSNESSKLYDFGQELLDETMRFLNHEHFMGQMESQYNKKKSPDN